MAKGRNIEYIYNLIELFKVKSEFEPGLGRVQTCIGGHQTKTPKNSLTPANIKWGPISLQFKCSGFETGGSCPN